MELVPARGSIRVDVLMPREPFEEAARKRKGGMMVGGRVLGKDILNGGMRRRSQKGGMMRGGRSMNGDVKEQRHVSY